MTGNWNRPWQFSPTSYQSHQALQCLQYKATFSEGRRNVKCCHRVTAVQSVFLYDLVVGNKQQVCIGLSRDASPVWNGLKFKFLSLCSYSTMLYKLTKLFLVQLSGYYHTVSLNHFKLTQMTERKITIYNALPFSLKSILIRSTSVPSRPFLKVSQLKPWSKSQVRNPCYTCALLCYRIGPSKHVQVPFHYLSPSYYHFSHSLSLSLSSRLLN